MRLPSYIPPLSYIVRVILVCLGLGALLAGGIHPDALFGLAFAAALVLSASIRRAQSGRSYAIPAARQYLEQRDLLFERLEALVKAIKDDPGFTDDDEVATRVAEAQAALDKVWGF